ncbi:MAG: HepT-like ribonuclease domain-containing protein [Candidatus Electronema sp. V4]|uniref:HepT-like ribonuclease domain-containing protein n=1 Tax=Candidatus Electronema sp. V4 TaxID=3454756 RepID=UPI0040557673
MKPEIRKYLLDIETSISSIEEYLGEERNFKKYEANKLLRRGIEIIGEAVNRILKLDASVSISEAWQIVDTRNWVIHGYDNVIIWGIIVKYLPLLKQELQNLLKSWLQKLQRRKEERRFPSEGRLSFFSRCA